MTKTIIGIDLGTTNSCLSVYENGVPRIIENVNGGRTTPSVVAFTNNGEVLVGDSAKRQAVTNPKNTLFAIKRLIGRKFNDPEVQKDLKTSPFKIIEHTNGDAWVEVNGKAMSPQQISAEILKALKKDAENYLGKEVTHAVITVPAYFNDGQRQATKDAGKLAGLEVERVINEPTSAALAYGEDKKKEGKVVVYDLGGGTFDVSVIEIENIDGEKTIQVLSTNGDTKLGGEDFDNVLINYVAEEFKKEHGFDVLNDPMAKQRVKEACEKAKIELSSGMQTDVNLPYITADATGPKHLLVKVTRAKFESLVEHLIVKSLVPCEKALKDAELTTSDIDEVILVGGMTRMPLVQQKVKEFFGKEPRRDVNPDEAVSIGAAIQGSVLTGDKNDILLLDVTPLSLGLEVKGGIMDVLIPRNTTIPTKATRTYTTAEDGQKAVTISVYQGERKEVYHNQFLDRFNLENIPNLRSGEAQIEITFDINADGILKVTAVEKSTGKSSNLAIKSNSGLSDDEIEKMVQEAELNKAKDEERVKLIQARNNAEYSLKHLFETKKKEEFSQEVQDLVEKVNKEIQQGNDAKTLDDLILELTKAVAKEMPQEQNQAQDQTHGQSFNPEGMEDVFNNMFGGKTQNNQNTSKPDDVIDADFEEKK